MASSLSEMMRRLNTEYYKSPSTSIHSDFLTYAQSPDGMLPKACATDFYNRNSFGGKNGEDGGEEELPLHVLEIGVGEGNFARGFLSELQRLDKNNKTDLSERATYNLADFSKAMLEKASKNLEKAGFANVIAHEFDASSAEIPSSLSGQEFIHISCNELFSDLPANMFVRKGKTIFEVIYDEKMNSSLRPRAPSDPLGAALLSRLPEGYFIPINSSAAKSACAISSLLANGGVFDIFDYGFYRADDFSIPQKMWNSSVVREYGTQWTVDLNFIQMAAELAPLGLKISVEPQKDFAERAFGEKLALADSENGLTYSKASALSIGEDDSFYHLRAEAEK